jgi:cell division protein FtsB
MADVKIKSEELATSRKTGDTTFDVKKEDTTNIDEDLENEKISDKDEQTEEGKSLTPFEISRTKYWNSEKKKNEAKTAVLNILKYLIPIFVSLIVGLLAIFGGIWAYKLNNIAEPIGGIKVEIQYIKGNIADTKVQIQKLQDKIDQIDRNNVK